METNNRNLVTRAVCHINFSDGYLAYPPKKTTMYIAGFRMIVIYIIEYDENTWPSYHYNGFLYSDRRFLYWNGGLDSFTGAEAFAYSPPTKLQIELRSRSIVFSRDFILWSKYQYSNHAQCGSVNDINTIWALTLGKQLRHNITTCLFHCVQCLCSCIQALSVHISEMSLKEKNNTYG